MCALINVALLALIGLCVYEAFHRNLFECALLLGRTFFAFAFAMEFFEPAAARANGLFDLPMPYLRGLIFFAIWLSVVWGFESFAFSILKTSGRRMKFKHQRPAQGVIGVLSGFWVAGALSVNLVMLPAVEGLYFENNTQPIAGTHVAAGRVYGTLSLSSTKVVPLAQMGAGAHWVEARAKKLMAQDDVSGAAGLLQTFEQRYSKHLNPRRVRNRRQQILMALGAALETPAR